MKDFKFTSTNDVYVDEGRSTTVTNPYYGSYASSNGIVSKTHARIFAYNFQQLLNYTKEIGKHNINVMLGHEYNRYEYYNLNASKSNMFDPNNHELAGAVTDGSQDSYTTLLNREGYLDELCMIMVENISSQLLIVATPLHASILIIVGVISGRPVLLG